MKIIINERQLRTIIESEKKISDKKLKAYKETVDELGLDYAAELFDKEPWELIEMGVVESYGGEYELHLNGSPIKSLGNLKSVNNMDLANSDIETLGSLEKVGGHLFLNDCENLTSLGNLISVGDFLDLKNTQIKSLGNLEEVGDFLDLESTKIKSLGKLKYVGGDLYIKNCPLSDLSDEEIRSQVEIKGDIIYII